MDPALRSRTSTWKWLPRTRGDGPLVVVARGNWIVASPHTRGWTPVGHRGYSDPRGFPAHAGMDPGWLNTRIARNRLPRTRGDGPPRRMADRRTCTASPHTRGWTWHLVDGRRRAWGFPAHAGMDPGRGRRRAATPGLPRTRGDGPLSLIDATIEPAASPHTRGWTRAEFLAGRPAGGFPAHAGMDPKRPGPSPAQPRLPRTRGDGPAIATAIAAVVEASPHTRGWTRGAVLGRGQRHGFPAHAGMDPKRARRPCRTTTASPHTRGWTRSTNPAPVNIAGFPAHAGMDP